MCATFLPTNNTQRNQVACSVADAASRADADPTFVTLERTLFSAARVAYVDAQSAWTAASAKTRAAGRAAELADADFDRALRAFGHSLSDGAGRLQPRVLSELLGGMLLGRVITRGMQEEVVRANGLFTRLAERADLSYDAACADALRTSTDALSVAARAYNDAHNAELAAGRTLAGARRAFDLAYRRLLASARSQLSETTVLSIFPRFSQSRGDGAGGALASDGDAAGEAGSPSAS